VDVRPNVQATTDVKRPPLGLRQRHHARDLDAVWIKPLTAAIDQSGSDHAAAHPTLPIREYQPVDCGPAGPFREGLEGRVLVENSVAGLSPSTVGDGAGAARLNVRFSASLKCGEDRLHDRGIIGVGRIDNRLRTTRLFRQETLACQHADHWLDAEAAQPRCPIFRARQAVHLMAGLQELHGDRSTYITSCTCDEDLHVRSPLDLSQTAIPVEFAEA
jgi:hypothetical protein